MSLTVERPQAEVQPQPAPRRARFSLRRLEWSHLALVLAALVVIYLAIVPVGTMLYASLRTSFLSGGSSTWTLDNYVETLSSMRFARLVGNSFLYATGTAAIGTAVGFGLAWLVVRTDTPGKNFARAAVLISFIIPGVLSTVAWALLLAPTTGPLNEMLRAVHLPAFDIYSMAGMIFVQSMNVTPIAFLMGIAAFVSMDRSLEDAALASGASPVSAFRRITMRLVRPALLSAILLMFIHTISGFEVPGLIGVPGREFVFVSVMFQSLRAFPADYGSASVIGVFVLFIAVIGLMLSRRLTGAAAPTITGKGFRSSVTEIGRWRWVGLGVFILYFIFTVALPLAMVIWASLLPGYQPFSLDALHDLTFRNYERIFQSPGLLRSVRNSLIVAVATGLIVTMLAAVVAYITVKKTSLRGRGALDGVAMVPMAVPSIVLGIGVLFWYLVAPLPFQIYGTLLIMIVAFVTIGLPYGIRYLSPGMAQIDNELEEAATANGASWFQTFWRVFIPLLFPSLLASFLYTMIIAFREVSGAIFLYSEGNEVVAVKIYDLWTNGNYSLVAALGVLMVTFLMIVVIIAQRLSRRLGIAVQ